MKIKIFNKKGFTLIELLIVIAIIGVLSSLLMANFVGVRERARDAQRKSDLRQIQSALEIYRADNSIYPTTTEFPATCGPDSGSALTITTAGTTTTYMQKIPCDPLENPYAYSSATGSEYSIIACLENTNDSQKDLINTCASPYFSYTVVNP